MLYKFRGLYQFKLGESVVLVFDFFTFFFLVISYFVMGKAGMFLLLLVVIDIRTGVC